MPTKNLAKITTLINRAILLTEDKDEAAHLRRKLSEALLETQRLTKIKPADKTLH